MRDNKERENENVTNGNIIWVMIWEIQRRKKEKIGDK